MRRMMFIEDMIKARLMLGSRVRRLRKGQDLTQEQLGTMVGIDRTRLSRLETGQVNVTFDTLMRLSSGLGLTVSEMLMGIEVPLQDAQSSLPIIFSLADMRVVIYRVPQEPDEPEM